MSEIKDFRYIRGSIELDQAERRFQRIFSQQMSLTRKDARKQFKTEARGVMRFVFAVTPPMGGKQASISYGKNIRVDFSGGKKAGQINIKADIKRAFVVARKHRYGRFSDALSYYLDRRNNRKRVKGKFQAQTSRAIILEVQKAILARQGWVPSGWNLAASALGFKPPGWISRWATALSQKFTAIWESDTPFFEAINGTNHRDSDSVNRRIAIAVHKQSDVMLRRIKALAEKQLKSSLG